MSGKIKATRAAFERLVTIMEAVPFHGPGKTAQEILEASGTAYDVETLTRILDTQISRGWVTAVAGFGDHRVYRRELWNPTVDLAELITVI